ncbi:PIN domain-containing protein [Xanthomonas sp. GPE 39]|uniref:PIN domain-containing protein n=1 Tax=Xanthomonas sp. GPE 39 TaxID=1583099 RepID=UPI0005F29398|nr:PIN domain-containing protein [Xanthomonas sp. GPE 39]
MIYVFDTNSLSKLKHYYPNVFKSIWAGLDGLVASGDLISTREVWNEMQLGVPNPHVQAWLDKNKHIFRVPQAAELQVVAHILAISHFQALIGTKQQLNGTPVADPFVIALAKTQGATVVTEEELKPNAAKVPNVCQHFGVPCMNLEQFMQVQGWSF